MSTHTQNDSTHFHVRTPQMDLWISQRAPDFKLRKDEDDSRLYILTRLCMLMNLLTLCISTVYHKQILDEMRRKGRFNYHPTPVDIYMTENADHYAGWEKEDFLDDKEENNDMKVSVFRWWDVSVSWWPFYYKQGKEHYHPLEDPDEDPETQWVRKLEARLRKGYKIGLIPEDFNEKVIKYDKFGHPENDSDDSEQDEDSQEGSEEDSQEGSKEGRLAAKRGKKKMKRPKRKKGDDAKTDKKEENAWLAGQKNKGKRKFFCCGPQVEGSGGSPTSGKGGGKKKI